MSGRVGTPLQRKVVLSYLKVDLSHLTTHTKTPLLTHFVARCGLFFADFCIKAAPEWVNNDILYEWEVYLLHPAIIMPWFISDIKSFITITSVSKSPVLPSNHWLNMHRTCCFCRHNYPLVEFKMCRLYMYTTVNISSQITESKVIVLIIFLNKYFLYYFFSQFQNVKNFLQVVGGGSSQRAYS